MRHNLQARRQAYTVRSATTLKQGVQQNMQEMSPGQIREWRPAGAAAPVKLEPSQRQEIVQKLADLVDEAQSYLKLTDMGQKDSKSLIAGQFEMPRDIDGNPIYLDGDRAYIVGPDNEKIFVKVFKASIAQGQKSPFGAVCTPDNPNGTVEALVVEPLPVLQQGQ